MHEGGGILQLDKYQTYYLPPTTYNLPIVTDMAARGDANHTITLIFW